MEPTCMQKKGLFPDPIAKFITITKSINQLINIYLTRTCTKYREFAVFMSLVTKAEKVCLTGAQVNRPITYQNSNTAY